MTITRGGSTNLHGTLKFLSKKYCVRSDKRRNFGKIPRRGRASLPKIRKASAPRSDLRQIVSTDDKLANRKHKVDGDFDGKGDSSDPDAGRKGIIANDSAASIEKNTDDNSKNSTFQKNEDGGNNFAAGIKTTTRLLQLEEDFTRYDEAEKVQKQAMEKIERARRKVYNDQTQKVWGVYLYGLKHVLTLNDLSDAPDAILPGNFQES